MKVAFQSKEVAMALPQRGNLPQMPHPGSTIVCIASVNWGNYFLKVTRYILHLLATKTV